MTIASDWVCEVLSPSTAAFDRIRKKHVYARESVEYVWLVDPVLRTLEVYRLREGRRVECDALEGAAKVRAEPLEAVELEALWIPTEEGE